MGQVSILVGLKNNLDYSKHFYKTTRELYPDVEIVFVSYGSVDGTDTWLESLEDNNVKFYYSDEEKTFSDTYNKCIALASKEYVLFAHNDMVLAPGFLENLENNVSLEKVLCYTVVEPSVFPDDYRIGKKIQNFGFNLIDFNKELFYEFVAKIPVNINDGILEIEKGFFFLCTSRQILMSIGGLDPLFKPMFCEDDDLLIRLRLSGLKFFWVSASVCYHFVSKTSRFSEEYQNKTEAIERRSNRNFFRKWRFRPSTKVFKRFDTCFYLTNASLDLVEKLEPLCEKLYVDIDPTDYIRKEQAFSPFDLKEKIHTISDNTIKKVNHKVFVRINGKRLKEKELDVLHRLNEIADQGFKKKLSFIEKLMRKSKRLKIESLKIYLNDPSTTENNLIVRNHI